MDTQVSIPSVATAETSPQQLVELLMAQRELYRRLTDLSARQRGLITGDHPEQLLNILSDRQKIILALSRLNEQLSPYRRNWEAHHAALPEATRQQVSALLDEINGTLQAIIAADREDGALLSARKQAVARTLDDVRGGRTANRAYISPDSGGSIGDVTA
jgi:FlgN protein